MPAGSRDNDQFPEGSEGRRSGGGEQGGRGAGEGNERGGYPQPAENRLKKIIIGQP